MKAKEQDKTNDTEMTNCVANLEMTNIICQANDTNIATTCTTININMSNLSRGKIRYDSRLTSLNTDILGHGQTGGDV